MAFCSNCGVQLQANAKFCPECGTKCGESASNGSKRVQTFKGQIKKCPSCGASVSSFSITCSECGHEFVNESSNEVQKRFQAGLLNFTDEKKIDFIASFPIPNTREDLGNFVIMLGSTIVNALNNGDDKCFIVSYKTKYDELKSKINISLSKDDPIYSEVKKFDEKIKLAEKQWKKEYRKNQKQLETDNKKNWKLEKKRHNMNLSEYEKQGRFERGGQLVAFIFLVTVLTIGCILILLDPLDFYEWGL